MAVPTPQTEGTRADTEAVARVDTRTVAITVSFAAAQMPQIRPQELQPLAQAAARNNPEEFATILRVAAPRADPETTFDRFRNWLDLAAQVTERMDGWREAHRRRDNPTMTREGQELARIATQGVVMGITGAPVIILRAADSELTDPQAREDFARAAVGYGFSVTDVMNVFGDLGRVSPRRTEAETDEFMAALQNAAVERSQAIMRRLQEMQDDLNRSSDPSRRRVLSQERIQLLREYGRLAGRALATEVVDQFVRSPREQQGVGSITMTDRKMEKSIRDETQHIFDLHTGRLDRVLIVPGEMAGERRH